MWRDTTRAAIAIVGLLALLLVAVLSLRSQNQPAPSPTFDAAQVQTKAVATFARGLTSTVSSVPTETPTYTPEPAGTAATAATGSVSPTPSCYRLKFQHDITIPDYTVMTPAQVFTKTWEVENTGTCAWRTGFKMVLVGGVAMGGSPFVVAGPVNPGAKIQISIKMAAPTNQTGLIQGTWRMTDDQGTAFGDALTAVIVIGGGTGVPTTASATAKP